MVFTESRKFQRNKEDFVCVKCGSLVHGNGYTNHCPYCLWSKHVDFQPGDRQEGCQGMMQPISVELRKGKFILTHRCLKCGKRKTNRAAYEDNLELVLQLSQNTN